jgi:hypothetical protein
MLDEVEVCAFEVADGGVEGFMEGSRNFIFETGCRSKFQWSSESPTGESCIVMDLLGKSSPRQRCHS